MLDNSTFTKRGEPTIAQHITARLAWHDSGWSGRICEEPDCNSYCVGRHSYPGDVIARERNLGFEKKNAGKAVAKLQNSDLPPCSYGINAFGSDAIKGYSNPPDFFRGGTRTVWDIPPYTVCVWPYECMYRDNVKRDGGGFDNDQRSENTKEFFSRIEPNRSFIFYYANYSNPFSEEESLRYVLVGVSRVKNIGDRMVYDDTDERIRKKYAGGVIWARNISSHYPDQGMRLPYHLYSGDPDTLARFAVFPENPNTCKYCSLLISDDDAIGLLEQFLSAVYELKTMGDSSENWDERERWLIGCLTELWSKRGLYPGLLTVMRILGAEKAIIPVRKLVEEGESRKAHELFFRSIENNVDVPQLGLTGKDLKKIHRQWSLRPKDAHSLLRDVLPRMDLDDSQMERIIRQDRKERQAHGLEFDLLAPTENPYLICENYVGDSPEDTISWSSVDRGVLPSPDTGGEYLADMEIDDPRRLRALCVEQLRREPNHAFRVADSILQEVNDRLEKLPDWKAASFTERYFEVDRGDLEEALVLRSEDQRLWLYLRNVYDDERDVEDAFTKLAGRSDISLNRPFSEEDWFNEIIDNQSSLLEKERDRYRDAVSDQASACESIFRRPLSVITGAAGTGKTTAICAIIRAVRKTEGDGASITVMAPTGKASDRVRSKLSEPKRDIKGVETSTVHSFLAKNGWLNKNLTLKRTGGNLAGNGTIIVDEASMLDLGLMATLVRAIDWRQVNRFIMVGDPNQLPPIGRGRVFADIIKWLSEKQPDAIAHLEKNLRLMENMSEDKGTSILKLANLFITSNAEDNNRATSSEAEELLMLVHKGDDVDKDLRIVYWDDPQNLCDLLIDTIEREMSNHVKQTIDSDKPYELWRTAFEWEPEKYQVLTPHRAEVHGVESLNESIQNRIAYQTINWCGMVDGITLGDKVIQCRNRPQSDRIRAYNFGTGKEEQVEVFNGEIGFVQKHSFDKKQRRLSLKRFQVKFARKKNLAVAYGRDLAGRSEKVEENLELAYAISIHKAQGSEFNHTYVLVPKSKGRSLSSELLYTALTRATEHCTLFIQDNISTLLSARRPENAQARLVNSSLFNGFFQAVPDELISRKDWYEEGKIHKDLAGNMVRSKSELVIANILHEREIPFRYEVLLKAPDGTMYLPDFTIIWNGKAWYWEHWGMISEESYKKHRQAKVDWYDKHFPGQLLETYESPMLSQDAVKLIEENFLE